MAKELSFTIFCIENYKAHRSLTGKQVWDLFSKYGVFDYLNEFYDVLHSTSHQFINNDIDGYLTARNAVLDV